MIPEAVQRVLHEVSRRHLIQSRVELGLAVLAWTLSALALCVAAVRFASGPPNGAALAVVATVAATVAFARLRRPALSPLEAARLVDAALDLKDRIATAVERHGESVRSPIAYWQVRDAEQHAHFVNPKEVIPYRPAFVRRGVAVLLGTAALAAAFILPLPEGILSPRQRIAPPETLASSGAVDDLLRRAEDLQVRASLLRTPAMERLVEDLSQLQAGLRSRTLPHNEALALLELLERRVESAAGSGAQGGAVTEESLEHLQSLAERVRLLAPLDFSTGEELSAALPRLAQSLEGTATAPALERAFEALESGEAEAAAQAFQNALEQAAATGDGEPGSREPTGDPGFADPVAGGEGAGDPSQATGGPSGGEPAPGGSETGSEGAGAGPGVGAHPGGPNEGSLRPSRERLLPAAPIQGEVGPGPFRFGQLQGSLSEAQGAEVGFTAQPFAAEIAGAAPLFPDESIPLDYREPVRLYFRRLEPTQK